MFCNILSIISVAVGLLFTYKYSDPVWAIYSVLISIDLQLIEFNNNFDNKK